ncbi:CAP domain-containing protein [Cryobacterium melibiosiphilum]|uniref:CAP domain-containing protein n=1 Tax=Cryobacterium melibiosiphilum TaxID=995039 RepID=A0A3A5MTK1_9MICO|nr:CAP domain-containing protein [Cryobacterium melibiosiphilum]RJT88554.1 CAP domain-containing protein [Cryobacterium melibiosiphilum]
MLTVTTRTTVSRWIGVAVLSTALTLGSIAGPALAAPSDIDRILVDTNMARAAAGLPALKHNLAIDAVAQAWAQKMATDGFAHNPSYSTQIPAGWSLASENIAGGYSAATVVNAWLNSPGHRTNIMSAATDIGIGFYVAPNGTAYSVQNFAKYPPSTTSATLTATPTPTVSGSALLGRTLTANAGAWGPAPVTLGFQWTSSGVKIPGATAPTYVPVAADLGKRLAVTVTGTKAGYTTVAKASAGTAAVKGTLTATPTPTISGTAKVGQILSARVGTWSPAPVTLLYQWARGGTAISGATASTYAIKAADVGATLTVTVTGTKPNYGPVARKSQSTAPVAP